LQLAPELFVSALGAYLAPRDPAHRGVSSWGEVSACGRSSLVAPGATHPQGLMAGPGPLAANLRKLMLPVADRVKTTHICHSAPSNLGTTQGRPTTVQLPECAGAGVDCRGISRSEKSLRYCSLGETKKPF
jgi:hypothetical protein